MGNIQLCVVPIEKEQRYADHNAVIFITQGNGAASLFVAQQRGGSPHNGRLAMQVSGLALAIEVVLHAVQLACAGADLGNVVVLIDVANHGDPSAPGGWGAVSY